ncbi:MAG: hypothetical protein ACPL3P_01530 [Anaerolineales bacterium]
MLNKFTRPLSLLSLLALVALACSISTPAAPQPAGVTNVPAEAIYTSAAQTLAAQLTENAPPEIPPSATLMEQSQAEEASPTATFTPILFTSTATGTATPPFTATPTLPSVTANQNTNCRSGPGPLYDVIGSLKLGETSYAHGRNSTSSWWYIENPRKAGSYCWVWSGSTTLNGSTSSLAVLTPPPPPPTATISGAAFKSGYATRHKCSGDYYAYFSVSNNGGKLLESASIKIRDMTAGTVLSSTASDNPFLTSTSDCPPGEDQLDVGEKAYVAGFIGAVPSGHVLKANIYLCTKEGLAGTCESIVVQFTAP